MKRPRPLVLALAVASAAVALCLGAGLGRARLESAIRARLAREASRRGVVARAEVVSVGFWPLLRLVGVRVEKPGAWSAACERVDVRLRLPGRGLLGRTRLTFARVRLTGPAGLEAEVAPTSWDVVAVPPDGLGVELREPAKGLTAAWFPGAAGGRFEATATDVPAGGLLKVWRDGVPLLDAGRLSGSLRIATAPAPTSFDLDASSRAVRVSALSGEAPSDSVASFGQPTDVTLRLAGSWRRAEGALEVPRWRATVDGAALGGSLTLSGVGADPCIDLSLDVERVDFARLFRTSGLAQPEAVAVRAAGTTAEGDLGSASLSAHAKGRLADPASFVVTQRLDFTPPRRVPPALERLRGDFVHEVVRPSGERMAVDVSPESADFVALRDVPPLFVRTLLLGEDAGFFAHRGIDLAELPSAILTNWTRGGAARGASTITQQLAKNLFLSRERRLGRKLQELSLALLLEATLGKQRILEIYLNVIEWGPGLYGVRPAARRYFHKEPQDLTPAQMALLVAIVPGPLKYQRSLARGTPSPFLRELVNDLLAKLCAVGALSEDQYQAALAEDLAVDREPEGVSRDPASP